MIIDIKKLTDSLQQVDWNYDFKIICHKDGSATLEIPSYIFKDIKWAVKKGKATPKEQIYSGSSYEEDENSYWEWDSEGNQIAVIYGEYSLNGEKIVVTSRNEEGTITGFKYVMG